MGTWESNCANKGRAVMSGHMGMKMCKQGKDSYKWAHGNDNTVMHGGMAMTICKQIIYRFAVNMAIPRYSAV